MNQQNPCGMAPASSFIRLPEAAPTYSCCDCVVDFFVVDPKECDEHTFGFGAHSLSCGALLGAHSMH